MTRTRQQERAANGMKKAEWGHRVRPDRLAPLADKYLDLEMTRPNQIVSFAALPERAARGDEIGRKLEALGLAEPTVTPPPRGAAQTTPTGGAR